MYTQCPECESAFRVTADVLKIAAGMVRCGSCGHAFNSLDFLSEDKPQRRAPAIPELQPEPDDVDSDAPGRTNAATLPKSISAEQSAALLKTLDQLAGEDIRIEDTGVEWRVLDDNETDDDPPEDHDSESDILKDPELTNAFFVGDVERYSAEQEALQDADDEPSDETPTVTDLRATHTPDDVHRETQVDIDANVAGVFAGGDASPTGNESVYGAPDEQQDQPQSIFHPSETRVDEVLHSSETPIDAVLEESHGETAVDDWPAPPDAAATEGTAPESHAPSSVQDELRFDDNTPLPDDFLDDEDEDKDAMNGASNVLANVEDDTEADDDTGFQTNVTLGDPDEWQQLLNEFDGLLSDAKPAEASADMPQDDADALAAEAVDERPGEQAEADEDDWGELADIQADEQTPDQPNAHPESDDEDVESDNAVDPEAADADSDVDEDEDEQQDDVPDWATEDISGADLSDSEDTESSDDEDSIIDEPPERAENESEDEPQDEFAADAESSDDEPVDLTSILEPDDDGLVDDGEHDPERDDSDLPEMLALGEDERDPDFDVPPQTEEEQTINMLIDQDLLSIAREDEDGFTSTIVYQESEDPLSVSSITMQGENLIEEKILQMDTGAHHVKMDEARGTPSEDSIIIGAATEARPRDRKKLVGFGIAAALLALILVMQAVHQRRAQLATDPRLFSVLAPVYEALGMPLTPDWDVSQWTIERTQGATDGSDQLLTILSELRNTSSKPMPYPIITVSLTDRYQETIGSLVVEPGTYLGERSQNAGMVDPGQLVEAEIPIDAPSPNTVGYSINACYRDDGSQLRCAMADFR